MITSSWKFGLNVDEVDNIRAANNDNWDEFDEKSIHLVIYNEGVPVGCGSIYFDNCYHIAHLNVLPQFQRQYIGDLMIRLLLIKGFNMMAEKIVIEPNENSVEFFKKYGFKQAESTFLFEVTEETLIMNSTCGHDCTNCINKAQCGQKQ